MNATTKTAAQINETELDRLIKKEREVRKAYPRVIRDSLRKEVDGTHAGKYTVEIKCATRGCGVIRRVATSDLFQVSMCVDCTREARNAARRAARSGGETKPAPKVAPKPAKKAKAKPAAKEAAAAPSLAPTAGKIRKIRIKRKTADAGTLQTGGIAEMPVDAVEQAAPVADANLEPVVG